MRPTRIVLIGAGSVSFGPGCLADAIHCEALRGSTVVLVDIDPYALEAVTALARKLNEASGAGLKIEHTTDRRAALPGAEFVITSVAIRRNDLWRLDWEIPLKHGIRQVLGENGGPGGLSHSLRNIPVVLDICRDMEELCPDALLLNFSNPESRICLAVSEHTSIRSVGLCHGVFMGISSISEITGVPTEDIDVKAAGLNHFTWMTSVRRRSTGEDLYPLLRGNAESCPPDYLPLTRALMRTFGLFPSCSDDHIGEYLGFAWDKCLHHGFNFDGADAYREQQWASIRRMVSGDEPLDRYLYCKSGEIAFDIVLATIADTNELMPAVNIPNRGSISNLPGDAVVEVPAVVGASGIHGLALRDLPTGIAALCNAQIAVQKLTVEAAVTGSRELALQALLADPVVTNMDAAERCLDELLEVHAPYLSQFAR